MLLLLHGALGAQSQFDTLRSRLTHREIFALDFEGHGSRHDAARPFRMRHFAENVTEFLEARSAARVDVFGYSMGGYVALLLAATRPALIGRVFTFGTRLRWTPEIAAREVAQLDPSVIRQKVPKFAAALEARHTGSGWERVLANTAEMLVDLGNSPVLTTELFRSIAAPVRIAQGDHDHAVTLEESRDAMQLIANSEMEVFPRTPHPFERVSVDRLVFSIEEFFGRDA